MTEETQKQDAKKKAKTVPGLRITAKRDGFRRAGRAWSAAATDVPARELTKEQIASLKSEPMLLVTDIEIAPAEAERE